MDGALNILRKVAGDSPIREIVGSDSVIRPVRVRLSKRKVESISSESLREEWN